MPKLLHVIVACSENRVIGRGRKLPWHIPEDLAYFHRETAGQVCVLGRICYETWPRVRKDGRQPVVLTSRPLPGTQTARPSGPLAHARGHPEATEVPARGRGREQGETDPIAVRSLAEALAVAETLPGEIFICGGQRIYEETLALNRPMRLHLTLVHAEVPGDTYFPEWRHLAWRELSRRESADANYRYTFFVYENR